MMLKISKDISLCDYFEPVILCPQNLWSNIVGSATESRGGVARPDSFLTHAIVCQLDVALVVQQHVVQLQVPVDNPPLVQVVKGQADFRAVEPGENQRVQEELKRLLHLACSSGSLLWRCMWNIRSPPRTNSITKNNLREESRWQWLF